MSVRLIFNSVWKNPGNRARRVQRLARALLWQVEGFEVEVFARARQLLNMDRPRLIMFESLGGTIADDISAILRDAGDSAFQIDEAGIPDFQKCWAQNLFAVPKEYAPLLI